MMNLNEERILDFLDGRLATPDEEELLHTLAVSPERRQVMRAHIRLRELTSNLARQERFTVPESVTDNLFSRLEEAGFNPPPVPQSMAVPSSLIPESIAAGAAGAGAFATAVSTGWRFGMMGLITASVMSFVLGAGAYYVFGSSLGLRTRSQELAALKHASPHAIAAAHQPVSEASIVSPMALLDNANAGNGSKANNAAKQNVRSLAISPISEIGPINGQNVSASSTPTLEAVPANASIASPDNSESISVTAPKEISYGITNDKMEFLNGQSNIIPNAIPAPYSLDRGTISVRYGFGPGYSTSNAPVSSMSEFRIGWTMWNYVLWRASMGQMISYERQAQMALNTKGVPEITTNSPIATESTMIGLEGGVTLDPLGVPVDALVGFMWSGNSWGSNSDYSPLYGRASLMAHFEPWKLLEISAGVEGIFYTHYLNNAIQQEERVSRLPASAVSSSALRSESCGLIGPALEIGWHF